MATSDDARTIKMFEKNNITEAVADTADPWTIPKVGIVLSLFVVASILEIGGSWLLWQYRREGKFLGLSIVGAILLIGYGFIATFQPLTEFGRLNAVYGGIFCGHVICLVCCF